MNAVLPYPTETIRRFEGVAIISDGGEHRYTVSGTKDILTQELAQTILLGELWNSHSYPMRVKSVETFPSSRTWVIYLFELEMT